VSSTNRATLKERLRSCRPASCNRIAEKSSHPWRAQAISLESGSDTAATQSFILFNIIVCNKSFTELLVYVVGGSKHLKMPIDITWGIINLSGTEPKLKFEK
jgi:hypothetical protein